MDVVIIVAIVAFAYFADQIFSGSDGSGASDTPGEATPVATAGSSSSPAQSGNPFQTIFTGGDSLSSLSTKIKLPQSVSDLIDKYAAMFGVDPNLAKAQAFYESGGNQNAKSPAGAIGVFQLEPATAAGLGVDPTNLEDNVKGGVQYLSQMLTKFGGDTTLALAAYNAGPGNVAKYGGVPPFAETQNYIKKILTAIGLGG